MRFFSALLLLVSFAAFAPPTAVSAESARHLYVLESPLIQDATLSLPWKAAHLTGELVINQAATVAYYVGTHDPWGTAAFGIVHSLRYFPWVMAQSTAHLKGIAIHKDLKVMSNVIEDPSIERLRIISGGWTEYSGIFVASKRLQVSLIFAESSSANPPSPVKVDGKEIPWKPVGHPEETRMRFRLMVDGHEAFLPLWEPTISELFSSGGAEIPPEIFEKWRNAVVLSEEQFNFWNRSITMKSTKALRVEGSLLYGHGQELVVGPVMEGVATRLFTGRAPTQLMLESMKRGLAASNIVPESAKHSLTRLASRVVPGSGKVGADDVPIEESKGFRDCKQLYRRLSRKVVVRPKLEAVPK